MADKEETKPPLAQTIAKDAHHDRSPQHLDNRQTSTHSPESKSQSLQKISDSPPASNNDDVAQPQSTMQVIPLTTETNRESIPTMPVTRPTGTDIQELQSQAKKHQAGDATPSVFQCPSKRAQMDRTTDGLSIHGKHPDQHTGHNTDSTLNAARVIYDRRETGINENIVFADHKLVEQHGDCVEGIHEAIMREREQQHSFCEAAKSDLKRRLAEFYHREYQCMPFIPSQPEHDVQMRSLYVPPKIVEKKQLRNVDRDNKIRIRTYTDFFMKDGHPCRNIFLTGEPGTGKSTFLQNLALQWSTCQRVGADRDIGAHSDVEGDFEDTDTLNRIEFLFHLGLRNANHYCDYVDIIRDQLLRNIYSSKEIYRACRLVESVLESPTSCIVSDGLDEWAHPINGSCHCPSRVKGWTPLICQPHSATIVTTSRPWRLAQLPPSESKTEKHLEIEGVENVEKLGEKIVNVLNKETETSIKFSDIEQRVRESNVHHLLTTPILLLQIVCLHFDGMQLSNSQSKTYASIVEMLIGRQSQDISGISVEAPLDLQKIFSEHFNIRRYWRYFLAVAREAFKQLFPLHGHPSVVFSSDSSGLGTNEKTFALQCGILTEKMSKSFSSHRSHLSFINRSWQEFLAAVYMSENEDLFETVIAPRYQSQTYDVCINDLSQVFVFICGLNIRVAEKMSTLMNTHLTISKSNQRNTSEDFTNLVKKGLHEAESNGFQDYTLSLSYMSFCVKPNEDQNVCIRLIEMNKPNLVSVTIDGFNNDLSSLSHCSALQQLELHYTNLAEQELVPPQTITSIDLNNVTATRGLASLEHCTNLQSLRFLTTDLGDQTLLLPDTVTDINLQSVKMSGGLDLQHCENLLEFTLQDTNLGDNDLILPVNITSIYMNGVTIPKGFKLQGCTQLQSLTLHKTDLRDNKLLLPANIKSIHFDEVTVTGGLESLQYCEQLQDISLNITDIGDHELLLPTNLSSLELYGVKMTGLSWQR